MPVAFRIHCETVLLLGWGSAILMQFAHPLVAQGVADHSGFRADARAPWHRLRRTLDAMLALTFGPPDDAARTAARINAVHDRVRGVLPSAVGRYPAGTPYSARDPALLTWVHATCLHAFMRAYETFVAPLTPAERDAYCRESAAIEPLLGIPEGTVPRSAAALAAYLDRMIAGGDVVVGDTARALARDLLAPPVLGRIPPARWGLRLVAAGLMPPALREAYGLPWRWHHAAALAVAARLIRAALRVAPGAVRHWPRARATLRGGGAVAGERVPIAS